MGSKIRLKLDRMNLALKNGDQMLVEIDGQPFIGIDVVQEDGKIAVSVGHWPDGEEWRVVAYLEKAE